MKKIKDLMDKKYNIKVRELRAKDKELFLKAHQEEPGCEKMYAHGDAYAELTWDLAINKKSNKKTYIIADDKTNDICGFCDVECEGKTPEIGINLLPEYQCKGIGAVALRKMMDIEKHEREIEYFIARIENTNIKSIKMIEKMGAIKMQPHKSNFMRKLSEYVESHAELKDVLENMMKSSDSDLCYMIY